VHIVNVTGYGYSDITGIPNPYHTRMHRINWEGGLDAKATLEPKERTYQWGRGRQVRVPFADRMRKQPATWTLGK